MDELNNNMNDKVHDQHKGFHFICGENKGLFYGRKQEDGGIYCVRIAESAEVEPFTLITQEKKIPYCRFQLFGNEGICHISDFSKQLSSRGIPLNSFMIQDLTNALARASKTKIAYESVGYYLSEHHEKKGKFVSSLKEKFSKSPLSEEELNQVISMTLDEVNDTKPWYFKKFELITPDRSIMKYEKAFKKKDIESVAEDLKTLYDISEDKEGFILAFSYSLFSPFAWMVRQRRYFFPNLIFLGLPETGKNSLLNLFLAKMWDTETNIKTTGDFDTEFAIMKNLEGTGLPIVINDLEQGAFDKMRKFFLEGAMNPKGGSRGRPSLELQEYQSLRGIAISSNFLTIGGPEATSRFIIHYLRTTDNSKASLWNSTAERLRGGMYPIAEYFIEYLNHYIDPETFLGYFRGNRLEVKRTVIEMGSMILEEILRMADQTFRLPRIMYEEYEEDNFSVFYSWINLALRKMQKEVNYYERDSNYNQIITVKPDDTFYIREENDKIIVFPAAYKKFLSENRDFPYRSMEGFAKAYPEYLKAQPRKFREGDDRKSFWVLIVTKISNFAIEVDPGPVPKGVPT